MEHDKFIQGLIDALKSDARFAAGILFGSTVNGSARPDSDIDVGVLCASKQAQAAVDAEYVSLLGRLGTVARRDVHLVDLSRADAELRRAIFRTGRPLFDRSEGAFKALQAQTLQEYFDWAYARRIIDEGLKRKLAAHG